MASHEKKKKKNVLRISLCDSRSCHQQGGGEHMKSDIEDLVSLMAQPADAAAAAAAVARRVVVQLTTCLGHCNRSPNILVESRGDVLLYAPTTRERHLEHRREQRFVNDGGFRMRVEEEEEEEEAAVATTSSNGNGNNNNYYTASHKVIVNTASIPKVAYALGIRDRPHAVRALEGKAAGNRERKGGRHSRALQRYESARAELLAGAGLRGSGTTTTTTTTTTMMMMMMMEEDDSISALDASLWLCCIQCRIQWAIAASSTDNNHVDEQLLPLSPPAAMQQLRLAIGDAMQILDRNKESSSNTNIRSLIATLLLQTAHHHEMNNIFLLDDDPQNNNTAKAPIAPDDRILAALCVALADGWCALAELCADAAKKGLLRQGALEGYVSILRETATATAATEGTTKALRLRERRRIERSIKALRNNLES